MEAPLTLCLSAVERRARNIAGYAGLRTETRWQGAINLGLYFFLNIDIMRTDENEIRKLLKTLNRCILLSFFNTHNKIVTGCCLYMEDI